MDRKTDLLIAAYEILRKCNEGPYVRNALAEEAYWDKTHCDGLCLISDIAYELDLPDSHEPYTYRGPS